MWLMVISCVFKGFLRPWRGGVPTTSQIKMSWWFSTRPVVFHVGLLWKPLKPLTPVIVRGGAPSYKLCHCPSPAHSRGMSQWESIDNMRRSTSCWTAPTTPFQHLSLGNFIKRSGWQVNGRWMVAKIGFQYRVRCRPELESNMLSI